ncbi:MAG: hypothetical protein KGI71_04850 [Patescibacteria group bacterium]|nr:hypothetical protein [Patescibacteria group bacterium]
MNKIDSDVQTSDRVRAQMARGRCIGGVWYRYDEDDNLVVWPVLRLDRLAQQTIDRGWHD